MTAPQVSVVIPAYHSDSTIASCLEGLRAQSFRDFEAIVVNSSQEERTKSAVERFPEVRFEQAPSRLLPHAARNAGVSLAGGRLLVFTDPDCRPRHDWLERLVAAHDEGHQVVVGAMGLASARWFERGVHLQKFSWLLPGLPAGTRAVAPTANALYAREVWDAVGPFDEDYFGGDGLLSWRAEAAGWRIRFEPRAIVEHRHGGDTRAFWRERRERGREFAALRAAFEGWSRIETLARLGAFPALPALLLARGARDAVRSGWAFEFLLTLPLQLLGHVAWCLGEARGEWGVLRRRPLEAAPA